MLSTNGALCINKRIAQLRGCDGEKFSDWWLCIFLVINYKN